MKRQLRKIVKALKEQYLFYIRTKAFKQRYKHIEKELFNKTLDDIVLNKYKKKWECFGKKVEIDTFLLSYNLSNKIDYNIIPENIFASIIERRMNPFKESSFFELKNIYEKWFNNPEVFPKTYLHKIDGVYYDENFQIIEDLNNYFSAYIFEYPLIIKSSKDTFGGVSVEVVQNIMELRSVANKLENFVCQELIIQNRELSNINNSSLNSIRSCLYRTSSGKFKVINNSIRFGVNGSLDNETSGGIVCNISEDGHLNDYAVDKYAVKYFEHPDSKIKFKDIKLPFYENLNSLAEDIANQIPLCNLISLDMSLDKSNNWKCIEVNLTGQTIRFAQYAGNGFFGKYTDEVINKTNKK